MTDQGWREIYEIQRETMNKHRHEMLEAKAELAVLQDQYDLLVEQYNHDTRPTIVNQIRRWLSEILAI